MSVATGGTGAPASAAIMSGMYAGAAAGGTGAALNGGGVKEILTGAALGGALGAAGGSVYAAGGAIGGTLGSATAGHAVASGAMLAGGAGYSYHQGGWTGVANFAGALAGGIVGGATASYVQNNWNSWFGQSTTDSNASANNAYNASRMLAAADVEQINYATDMMVDVARDSVSPTNDRAFWAVHGAQKAEMPSLVSDGISNASDQGIKLMMKYYDVPVSVYRGVSSVLFWLGILDPMPGKAH